MNSSPPRGSSGAVVDSSATVVRHSGASNVTASKMGKGTYEVTFANKNVLRIYGNDW